MTSHSTRRTFPGRARAVRQGRSPGFKTQEPEVVWRYLEEIGAHRTLSAAEERELGAAIREHARERREALCGIPFVARFLREHWEALRTAGRVTTWLAEERDPGAAERVDATLERVPRWLEYRERAGRGAEGRARRRRADQRIARALVAMGPSERVLDAAWRALREALREPAARRRQLTGLTRRELDPRVARVTRADEALGRAKQRFVEYNLKLVVRLAMEFDGMGVPFTDLVQEANLGLMRAVEKFDHERGFKFSTYAVWWIQQALIRAVQNHSRTVRLPSHLYERMIRWDRMEAELARRLGHEPEVAEVADALGLDRAEAWRLARSRLAAVSIDETRGEDDDGRAALRHRLAARQESPGAALDREHIPARVRELLATLDRRDQLILRHRFGLDDAPPETLERVGERLGLSRERVRQLEGLALARLRQQAAARGLEALLEGGDEEPAGRRSAA